MSEPSQKRALDNYRSRLKARGMARFEVLGLDQDRDLIRSLARQLGEGPDGVAGPLPGSHEGKAVFSTCCVDPRWSTPISISADHRKAGEKSICDDLSSGYNYRQ